jgi:hypothetical protein
VSSGQETTRLPVRSALSKQRTGGLVVRWVTNSECPLLNVILDFCFPFYHRLFCLHLLDGAEAEVGRGFVGDNNDLALQTNAEEV